MASDLEKSAEEFKKVLSKAIIDIIKITDVVPKQWEEQYWPMVRNKLKSDLIDNLAGIYEFSVSKNTVDWKRDEYNFGIEHLRLEGGSPMPVLSGAIDTPWKRTGVMEQELTDRITNDMGEIVHLAGETYYSIGAAVDDFVPGNVEGFAGPYPAAIDEYFMNSHEFGLVKLNDEQVSQIMDMMGTQFIDLVNKLFPSENGK